MRQLFALPTMDTLRRNKKRDHRLMKYLEVEIEMAYSARRSQEANWVECLRQYEGVPKNPTRDTPVENAPNIEVTLGAIATDALYAQALVNAFSQSPILTVLATRRAEEDATLIEAAKALEDFCEWAVVNEFNLRKACEHTFLDTCQLGTGVHFIPWVNYQKRTKVRKIVDTGPRIVPVPPEDFLAPSGLGTELDQLPWVDLRFWYTQGDLQEYANAPDEDARWDIDEWKPVASVDYMRQRREKLGRSETSNTIAKLYEAHRTYVSFDYDGDGYDEELLVIWDRTSHKIAWLGYAIEDVRPVEYAVYQARSHMIPGIGVMEMLGQYQYGLTEGVCDTLLNAKLANMRFFVSKTGAIDEGTISAWAGRNIPLNNPGEDLVSMQLGEVYPSAMATQQFLISMAERRCGVNELNTPRPSQVLGSRTPAFTTSAMLQQQSNRFAPAFDNMRYFAACSVKQCLWRYHEQLLVEEDDGPAQTTIQRVLGDKRAALVIALLRTDDFLQSVSVEMTATSSAISKDAQKQNAVMLVNLLGSYYQRTLELLGIAADPQTPNEVKDVAKQIAEKSGALIERTVREFDQVRDPHTFVLDVADELDAMKSVNPMALQQLLQIVSQLGQQGGVGGPALLGQ